MIGSRFDACRAILLPLFFFLTGLSACFSPVQHVSVRKPQIIREKSFGLTNPILDFEVFEEVQETALIRKKIGRIVDAAIHEGKASHISFYFRDLNNGPWIGINEKDEFNPASLLKVPVMMSCFKREEEEPGFINRTVKYDPIDNRDIVPIIVPPHTLTPGEYTIDEVLSSMIRYSDNNAAVFLLHLLGDESVNRTYLDLNLHDLSSAKTEYMITVKDYASFFRILYNSSYLSRRHSEKALAYLTQTSFSEGIVAGIPVGITVAHKFGEREFSNARQLHDCGIVYYPGHPYLICIMSRGESLEEMATVIRRISAATYEEVDRQFRTR